MPEKHYLPDLTRISILAALILLAFAMTRIFSYPPYVVTIPFAGVYVTLSFNLDTLFVLLAGGMTASGMNWLMITHPSLKKGELREHWLLPTLTVLVVGVALYTLPQTVAWWIGFTLGAAILLAVLYAEYVVVDPQDSYYHYASLVLTILAFVIFLILAIALKAANIRLYLLTPALFFGGGLVGLRAVHLQLKKLWDIPSALGIAVVTIQLGAALYYLPLTPVRFGLGLLGPVYALTSLATSMAKDRPIRQSIFEPAVMLFILVGLMVWFR